MTAAFLDRDSGKNVIARLPHENAKIIVRQDSVADDVVVEVKVQRDAGRQIVVQIKEGELAVLSVITSQAVKLIVESRIILDCQPPRARRDDQAAGTTVAANHVLDLRVISAPDINAVVINSRALREELPKLLRLVFSVAVYAKVGQADPLTGVFA